MTINLGDEVRDVVSGFTGIATARVEYLTGCIQFCVAPKCDTDGKVMDSHYFDEDRLVVEEAGAVRICVTVAAGPQDSPPAR